VRESKEIEELGGYEGAIDIPLQELEKRLGELPKDKTIDATEEVGIIATRTPSSPRTSPDSDR
jgi:hypothetical protein